MSSAIRKSTGPATFYVSVDALNTPAYTKNTTTGVWTRTTTGDYDGTVFRDLGVIEYFHPTNSLLGSPTAPHTDCRKVAVVDASGVNPRIASVIYIPLGTRVRGKGSEQTGVDSCWIARLASGVATA